MKYNNVVVLKYKNDFLHVLFPYLSPIPLLECRLQVDTNRVCFALGRVTVSNTRYAFCIRLLSE